MEETKPNIIPLLTQEEGLKINVIKLVRNQNPEFTYEQALEVYYQNFPECNKKNKPEYLIKKLFENQREISSRLNQLIQSLQDESSIQEKR